MGKIMSDHQTNAFSYSRTWEEIERMLDKAERMKNHHEIKMNESNRDALLICAIVWTMFMVTCILNANGIF